MTNDDIQSAFFGEENYVPEKNRRKSFVKMEDEDNNMDVFDDNTDGDRFYNFDDSDDDGDGYKTFREVLYTEYTDSSRSGLEAQLQALTPLNSNQFFTTIEAKDDGTFSAKLITLEDTNGNGIPNYLDSTDAATIN